MTIHKHYICDGCSRATDETETSAGFKRPADWGNVWLDSPDGVDEDVDLCPTCFGVMVAAFNHVMGKVLAVDPDAGLTPS